MCIYSRPCKIPSAAFQEHQQISNVRCLGDGACDAVTSESCSQNNYCFGLVWSTEHSAVRVMAGCSSINSSQACCCCCGLFQSCWAERLKLAKRADKVRPDWMELIASNYM